MDDIEPSTQGKCVEGQNLLANTQLGSSTPYPSFHPSDYHLTSYEHDKNSLDAWVGSKD